MRIIRKHTHRQVRAPMGGKIWVKIDYAKEYKVGEKSPEARRDWVKLDLRWGTKKWARKKK